MYYYDIYLCFDDQYSLFYNWDSTLVERYLKIEIIKVRDIKPLISNIVNINLDDNRYILCDGINAIAIEVQKGKVNCISSLTINDEDEIVRLVNDMEYTDLNIKVLEKRINDYSLKEFIIPKKVICLDIQNGSDDFIKYLYMHIFNKRKNNIELMRKKLLEDINTNFNDNYLNIYKIIYK